MDMLKERELFEEHATKTLRFKKSQLGKHPDGSYKNDELNRHSITWLASRNREGFYLVPLEPTENQWGGLARVLGRYMQSKDRYCPKTLKKYLDMFAENIPEWLNIEVKNWESEHAFATADLPVFIYKAMLTEAL